MIRMLTAYTYEADSVEYALEEILSMLKLDENLLKNAAGILFCHTDFVETGVAQEVSRKLPFDVIGCVTLSSAVQEDCGLTFLSVAVITSDEAQIEAFELDINSPELFNGYKISDKHRDERPKMVLPLIPTNTSAKSQLWLSSLSEAVQGAPIFGGLSFDYSDEFESCYTIINGEISRNKIVSLAFFGDFRPKFRVVNILESSKSSFNCTITKSQDSVVNEVDGKNLRQYLLDIGLIDLSASMNTISVPFIVDYNDGTKPVARALYGITEEGYGNFSADMPEGSSVYISTMSVSDVSDITNIAIETINGLEDVNGILMLPCATHYMFMGADVERHVGVIKKKLNQHTPYLMAYVGGEFCPMYDEEGEIHNKYHAFSFITCTF